MNAGETEASTHSPPTALTWDEIMDAEESKPSTPTSPTAITFDKVIDPEEADISTPLSPIRLTRAENMNLKDMKLEEAKKKLRRSWSRRRSLRRQMRNRSSKDHRPERTCLCVQIWTRGCVSDFVSWMEMLACLEMLLRDFYIYGKDLTSEAF